MRTAVSQKEAKKKKGCIAQKVLFFTLYFDTKINNILVFVCFLLQ